MQRMIVPFAVDDDDDDDDNADDDDVRGDVPMVYATVPANWRNRNGSSYENTHGTVMVQWYSIVGILTSIAATAIWASSEPSIDDDHSCGQ